MLVMLKSMALDWCIRFLVLLLAAFSLVWFSAWIDGKTPDFWSLTSRVGPIAASYSTGWAVVLWRQNGGDIIVGNRGCRPAFVCAFLLLLASIPTVAATLTRPVEPQENLGPQAVSLQSVRADHPTTFTWSAQGAIRHHPGMTDMEFKNFPRPSPTSKQVFRHQWIASLLWVFALAGIVLFTGLAQSIPTMGVTLVICTLAVCFSDTLSSVLTLR